MKGVISILLAIFVLAGISFSAQAADDLSLTFSTKAWSRYMSNNHSRILWEKPVDQSSLLLSYKGFSFELWDSVGLDGTNSNSDKGDEVNFIFSWKGKYRGFYLDTGVQYLNLFPLDVMPRGDLIAPYVEIGREFQISKSNLLAPYFRVGVPISAHNNELGHGVFTRVGVKHVWKIRPELTLSQRVNLFFDEGACNRDDGVMGEYRFDFSWHITKNVTFDVISVKVGAPFTSFADKRETEAVYGSGFTFRF